MIKHSEHLRATASKYRESADSEENSDFILLRQKDLFGELFSEIYFQSSSEFTFFVKSRKVRNTAQSAKMAKIVHFQHASTERRELAWISYSHGL